MANTITRQIPNFITCCNLLSGCMAACMAFQANYRMAFMFIVAGAVFDFFDGMAARLLHVSGPMGKELDSLADDITFGFAPATIVFSLFKEVNCPACLQGVQGMLPYAAFIIAAFSALRLGKFNIDARQTSSFIGLPTPANALFWASLSVGAPTFLHSNAFNAGWLLAMVLVMSYLLIAEMPMFSLKFKNLRWADNKVRFLFLLTCIPIFLLFRWGSLAIIIVWYILLSAITRK